MIVVAHQRNKDHREGAVGHARPDAEEVSAKTGLGAAQHAQRPDVAHDVKVVDHKVCDQKVADRPEHPVALGRAAFGLKLEVQQKRDLGDGGIPPVQVVAVAQHRRQQKQGAQAHQQRERSGDASPLDGMPREQHGEYAQGHDLDDRAGKRVLAHGDRLEQDEAHHQRLEVPEGVDPLRPAEEGPVAGEGRPTR